MTDQLAQIQASLKATAAICDSNARSIQANDEQISQLANTVDAFIQRLDSEGLRVTLVTQAADDLGGDVDRQDAIADRQAFIDQSEADRQAFREALEVDRQKADADRAAWQQSFNNQLAEIRATTEQNWALLDALNS